jgi:tRNA pseudouridine38-40 synthase
MRIALGLEYDGSRFCGWQSQPSACAVQDAVERALSGIAGHSVGVVTAGRTDAGVHAVSQVVHFDTSSERPETAWVRGVNALLPDSVGVLWARPVADEFHARFSAQERRYRYVLLNHPVRPALLAGCVGWYHAPLDVELMQEAGAMLLGVHDFSAFRAAECQAKTPVKDMRSIGIARKQDFILFDFRASAFLHHMVRNLVGSLIYIGKGKHPPDWMRELLDGRNRINAAPTFGPHGLYLTGIGYDAKWGLPENAARSPGPWLGQ